jgi:signal peptidase I
MRDAGQSSGFFRRVLAAKAHRKRILWLTFLFLFGGWSFLALSRPAFSYKLYMVPTGSMAPAIKPGDQIFVKATRGAKPRRGEIWTFEMPRPKGTAVKRVIGLPGETIQIHAGRVFIDGRRLSEPYLSAPFTYTTAPVKLGPSEYYLLGDSRDASNDCHIWGPVKESALIGTVQYRYWPPARVGGF